MTKLRFNDYLKIQRELRKIPQRQIANYLDIDIPMYSRIERGERKAKREQVIALEKFFNQKGFLKLWLADKVLDAIACEEDPNDVLLIVSEQLAEYGKN